MKGAEEEPMNTARQRTHRNAARWLGVLAFAFALAGGAVACNLLIGAGSFVVCTSVADAGWYDAGCQSCVEANCCAQAAACAADPACSARQSCLGGLSPLLSCPLAGGVEASAWKQQTAGPPSAALESCVGASCGPACGGGPWACVNGFSSWPDAAAAGAMVTVTLHPSQFASCLTTSGPLETIRQVTVCQDYNGTNCGKPLSNPGAMPGPFAIQVPVPFNGYLDVVPEPGDAGLLESLVYLSWPPASDTDVDLRFLSVSYLQKVATKGGVGMFDADAGTLVVLARDCLGDPAAGVSLAISEELMPNPGIGSDGFSFKDCAPGQAGAQEPDAAPAVTTTDDGVAGWANVRPGLLVTFGAAIDGGAVPIAGFSALVQPRSVTYVWLTPTPLGKPL
jgi:hypothetical protein